MKKLLSLVLAAVLTMCCLAGTCFANSTSEAIAKGQTGTETVFCATKEEIIAQIADDGTSVVTMLKNHVEEGAPFLWNVPSFTLVLGGFTIGSATNNAVTVNAAGSVNAVTRIVGPGVITAGNHAVCIRGGSIGIENNAVLYSSNMHALFLDAGTAANSRSSVTDSTVVADASYPIAYGSGSGVELYLNNSTVIASQTTGNGQLPVSYDGAPVSPVLTLGRGVHFYTTRSTYAFNDCQKVLEPDILLISQNTSASASVAVNPLGKSYTGLNHFYTKVDPLAVVTTGSTVTECTTAAEIAAAISPAGTSVVTMQKDAAPGQTFLADVPTFTLSLNGHTVGAVTVSSAGTSNAVFKVLGPGTVSSASHALRLKAGSIRIENGAVVYSSANHALYLDAGTAAGSQNVIENSTLAADASYPIAYGNGEGVNLYLNRSTVIASQVSGNGQLPISYDGAPVSPVLTLGPDVELYTTRSAYAFNACLKVLEYGTGLRAAVSDKSASVSVAALGKSYTGLNRFSTFSYLAMAENDGTAVGCQTPEEIAAALNPDGTTVVTMLQDLVVSGKAFLSNVPTFTLNLNGHKVGSATNNGITVISAGTEQDTMVVKNGTLVGGTALRSYAGNVEITDAVLCGTNGFALRLSQTEDAFAATANSTLVSTTNSVVIMEGDYAVTLTAEDSIFVATNTGGSLVFSGTGTVNPDADTVLYTKNYRFINPDKTILAGVMPAKTGASASLSIASAGISATGLNKWESSTAVLAEVQNGSAVTQCFTAAEIAAALSADGTSVVTMYGNCTPANGGFLANVPTFTLHLNGYTVGSINVTAAGTANAVTEILGPGIVTASACALRLNAGRVTVGQGAVLYSTGSYALYLDAGTASGTSSLSDAVLVAETTYPVAFGNGTDVCLSMEGSTIVAAQTSGNGQLPISYAGAPVNPSVIVGSDMNFYTLRAAYAFNACEKLTQTGVTVQSVTADKTASVTLVPLNKTYTGLNHFVSSQAETLTSRQNAVIETALAYYYKNPYVQYDRIQLSRAGRTYGARSHLEERNAPEYASHDLTVYTVCAAYAYDIIYNTFGYRLMGSPEVSVTKNLSYATGLPEEIVVYARVNTGDQTADDAAAAAVASLLQPGDVVTYWRPDGSGHTVIYSYDLTGDGKEDLLHASGGRYSLTTGLDEVETSGGILINAGSLNSAQTFLLDPTSSQYLGAAVRYSVVRPAALNAADYPMTAASATRMQHPGLEITYTAENGFYGSAEQNSSLTYTLKLKNNSSEYHTGLNVMIPIPAGAVLTAVNGQPASGSSVSFTAAVAPGKAARYTYTVTAVGAAGSCITASGGTVGSIVLPTLKTTITAGAPSAAQLQSSTARNAAAAAASPGAAFANAWLAAAGETATVPELSELLSTYFTASTYSSHTMYTPKETLHTMMVPDYLGGQNLKVSLASHRVLETRMRDLMPGDVLLIEQSLADTASAVAWVFDGTSLWALENGTLTEKTQTDLTLLHSFDFFILLRPSQMP